ncbi:MAG: hypothetical protein GJU76_09475, partial [Gallionella sp.]|nr:hypothetical protein [Gallionella sp.]
MEKVYQNLVGYDMYFFKNVEAEANEYTIRSDLKKAVDRCKKCGLTIDEHRDASVTKLAGPTDLPAQPEGLGLDEDGWALVCAVKETLKVDLKMPFIHLRHPTVPANPYDNVFGVGAATGGPPFVADEVIAAFHTYLQAFDGYRSAVELQSDTMRVPIAANSGCSGSGKTTQLSILGKHFTSKGGCVALYLTFNGGMQLNDGGGAVNVRIARRLIYAAARSGLPIESFWKGVLRALSSFGRLHESPVFDNPVTLMRVCRVIMGVPMETPVLILADELALLAMDSTKLIVGRPNDDAVAGLRFLAQISQKSAVEYLEGTSGRVYVVASAYAAYNPLQAATASKRPVFYIPIRPLPLHWAEEQAQIPRSGQRLAGVVAAARLSLWHAHGNARALTNLIDAVRNPLSHILSLEQQLEREKQG